MEVARDVRPGTAGRGRRTTGRIAPRIPTYGRPATGLLAIPGSLPSMPGAGSVARPGDLRTYANGSPYRSRETTSASGLRSFFPRPTSAAG